MSLWRVSMLALVLACGTPNRDFLAEAVFFNRQEGLGNAITIHALDAASRRRYYWGLNVLSSSPKTTVRCELEKSRARRSLYDCFWSTIAFTIASVERPLSP